jgi:glutathione-independent formaldehyde dehydrogenase
MAVFLASQPRRRRLKSPTGTGGTRGRLCDRLRRLRGQGQGSDGHVIEAPAVVLNGLMEITRPAGSIGIPGLYVTDDPGAEEKAAQQGMLSLRFGLGWAKSHSLHTGQTPVLKYNRQLMQAILWGRLPIGKIVNVKVISLDRSPEGYRNFDAGVPNKFVIDPHGLVPKAA